LLLAKGERDEPAIEAFSAALAMLDGDAHRSERALVHFERGRALQRSGAARRALPDLDEACALDPVALDAFAARARAHEALGEKDAAARDRERVAVLEGGYRDTILKMLQESFDEQAKGSHRGAVKAFAPAFELVPRSEPRQRASLYYRR